jgi:hypothetical protein
LLAAQADFLHHQRSKKKGISLMACAISMHARAASETKPARNG